MNFIIGPIVNGVIDGIAGFEKLPRLVEYFVVFCDRHRMSSLELKKNFSEWRVEVIRRNPEPDIFITELLSRAKSLQDRI